MSDQPADDAVVPPAQFNPDEPVTSPASRRRRIIAIFIILSGVGALISGLCVVGTNVKRRVMREGCVSNLRNIAAAMINYANAHGGHYPADIRELYSSGGISPQVMVCPDSEDEPATGTLPQQLDQIAAGKGVSYIYIASGVTSQADPTIVLAYDRPANHHGDGINILFDDYHISWIDKSRMKRFLAKVESGARPMHWPPANEK